MGFDFNHKINGASYAGAPRDNTMMYISKKVGHLVNNLEGHKGCVVFIEESVDVPDDIANNNDFIVCKNPQFEYAKFATGFWKNKLIIDSKRNYTLTNGGYYLGENVKIGNDAYIEAGVVIGHDVSIGNNAIIMAGAVIKNAIIGDNFVCNENAVVGDYSFTMADDEEGNKYRIPALGRVIIKNNVEIGACNDVAIGACGDTILEDNVKLDGLVHIGHEAHLHKNTEITAGAIVAGFVEMEEHSYLGINSSIKNRIRLGENCVVGMGSNVTKPVDDDVTVIGNPARPMNR